MYHMDLFSWSFTFNMEDFFFSPDFFFKHLRHFNRQQEAVVLPQISRSFPADRWSRHSSLRCGFQTAFSPFVLFVSQPKRLCGRITASAATTASGERTKESSAIVTLALYNLQVSMRCDITNKRPPNNGKKKILLSRHPSVICENMHLWGSGASAWMASI